MPSSDPRVLEATCREIIRYCPRTVLDIGVGFGKWGVLAREYTDIWNYRFYREEWQTFIVGIEIHERYNNPVWQAYNLILGGNASDVIRDIKNCAYDGRVKPEEAETAVVPPKHYDMTLMIDVLEHFPKEAGEALIKEVLSISDRFIVSYCNSEQKDVRDNKHEDHVSLWFDEDFARLAPERTLLSGGAGWGIYLLENRKG